MLFLNNKNYGGLIIDELVGLLFFDVEEKWLSRSDEFNRS